MLGINGSVDFRDSVTGFGAVLARGDITVNSAIDLHSDSLPALISLGTIYLLGTG